MYKVMNICTSFCTDIFFISLGYIPRTGMLSKGTIIELQPEVPLGMTFLGALGRQHTTAEQGWSGVTRLLRCLQSDLRLMDYYEGLGQAWILFGPCADRTTSRTLGSRAVTGATSDTGLI